MTQGKYMTQYYNFSIHFMARKYLKVAAAHARAQRAQHLVSQNSHDLQSAQNSLSSDSDSDVGYVGGVNCEGYWTGELFVKQASQIFL